MEKIKYSSAYREKTKSTLFQWTSSNGYYSQRIKRKSYTANGIGLLSLINQLLFFLLHFDNVLQGRCWHLCSQAQMPSLRLYIPH
jgi:hypothetical protein